MMFKQVKDIFTQIQKFHDELNDYYSEVSEKSDREKVKILLDSVKLEKNGMIQSVNYYREHGNADILNTWIQYTPEKPLNIAESGELFPKNAPVEDIVKLVLRHEEWLDEIFKYLAETAHSTDVKNLFARMHQNLEQGKRNLSKDASLIDDM